MSKLPADVLADLFGVRLGELALEGLLARYVEIAQTVLPGVEEASITLIRGERPFTAAHTGDLALAADEQQYERGHGPCLEAGQSGTVLIVPDMRAEARWPDYAAAVSAQGVLSSLSLPLPVQTDLVGALNCYARTADVLEQALEAGTELAAYIAVAIANAISHSESAQFAADMKAAMASRAVIEQAKGAIMAQNRCSADEAFEILRRASMGRNVKLRDLAADIVQALQT